MRKNMQKWGLKIQVLLLLAFVGTASGQGTEILLKKADSLYQQKKFTEASGLYFELYKSGFHSPATLLKMAYVHEGLQETGKALFFLSAYYSLTEDKRAFEKMTDLAQKQNIAGYEFTPASRLRVWLDNRASLIIACAAVLSVFLIALSAYSKRQGNSHGRYPAGFIAILFIAFGLVVNLRVLQEKRAVVVQESLIMSGPSAAANWLGTIAEGSPIEVLDHKDIWTQASWQNQTVYIRSADLLEAH
jgi:hypothetical protein